MSFQFHQYVGPYLKCYFHNIEKEKKVFGCKKCETVISDQLYCGKCGLLLTIYSVKILGESVDLYDIDEELNEVFFYPENMSLTGLDLFLLNVRSYKMRDFFIKKGQDSFQSIREDDIKKEIEWMKKWHKKEIDILRKYYDKVTIDWGVINYSM